MTDFQTFGQWTRKFFDPILDLIVLPGINQRVGRWEPDTKEKCCFGARIQHGKTGSQSCSFVGGENKVYDHYDTIVHGHHICDSTVMDLFFLCGSAWAPFGAKKWHLPVKRVMDNLYRIEHFSREILNEFIQKAVKLSLTEEDGFVSAESRTRLNRLRRRYLKKMWAYRYPEND